MIKNISKLHINLLSSFYLIIGLGLIILSGTIYLNPLKSVDIEKDKITTINNCNKNLETIFSKVQKEYMPSGLSSSYRYAISKNKNEVIIETNNLDANISILKDMDLILNICQGMKMDYFCMGDACNGSMVKLKMKYNGIIN